MLGIANGHEVLGIIPVDARDKIVHPALTILALACILRTHAISRPQAHASS